MDPLVCAPRHRVKLAGDWLARAASGATVDYDARNGHWIIGSARGLTVVDAGNLRDPICLGKLASNCTATYEVMWEFCPSQRKRDRESVR